MSENTETLQELIIEKMRLQAKKIAEKIEKEPEGTNKEILKVDYKIAIKKMDIEKEKHGL